MRADIARRIERVPLWHVAGNHGVEPWDEREAYASRVRGWMPPQKRRLLAHEGVVIEDKTYSVTERLGVTCLWLLPFYESPLLDDGYDIAQDERVHHSYGTLADFRRLLDVAHARGLQVVAELVINHVRSASLVQGGTRRAGRIAEA